MPRGSRGEFLGDFCFSHAETVRVFIFKIYFFKNEISLDPLIQIMNGFHISDPLVDIFKSRSHFDMFRKTFFYTSKSSMAVLPYIQN